jgi:hypothetical protein
MMFKNLKPEAKAIFNIVHQTLHYYVFFIQQPEMNHNVVRNDKMGERRQLEPSNEGEGVISNHSFWRNKDKNGDCPHLGCNKYAVLRTATTQLSCMCSGEQFKSIFHWATQLHKRNPPERPGDEYQVRTKAADAD